MAEKNKQHKKNDCDIAVVVQVGPFPIAGIFQATGFLSVAREAWTKPSSIQVRTE